MAELKPCPFCGGKAKLVRLGDEYCVYCGSHCCEQSIAYEDADMAIDAWNTRYEDGN